MKCGPVPIALGSIVLSGWVARRRGAGNPCATRNLCTNPDV